MQVHLIDCAPCRTERLGTLHHTYTSGAEPLWMMTCPLWCSVECSLIFQILIIHTVHWCCSPSETTVSNRRGRLDHRDQMGQNQPIFMTLCVCVCVCVCVGPLIATFWIFDEITAWDKAFCWVGTGAKPPLYGGNELMFCLLCSQLIVHLYVIKRAMLSVPVLTVRDSPINTAIMQSIDASVCFVIR